jgi:hypothetical protein
MLRVVAYFALRWIASFLTAGNVAAIGAFMFGKKEAIATAKHGQGQQANYGRQHGKRADYCLCGAGLGAGFLATGFFAPGVEEPAFTTTGT